MGSAPLMDLALSWLATFALHSTILLGAALLVGRYLHRKRAADVSILTRWAIAGALLTPTIQIGLGYEPFGGRIAWERDAVAGSDATLAANESKVPSDPALVDVVRVTPGSEELELIWLQRTLDQLESVETNGLTAPLITAGTTQTTTPGASTGATIISVWIALAAGLLGLLLVRWRRLTRVLQEAREWDSPESQRTFATLCARSGLSHAPQVLVSAHGIGPLTAGILTPRIVLPARAEQELSRRQLEAVLAHEIAHVEHRDALVSLVLSTLEALLWFQPLLRCAHRTLRDCAELSADDRAVQLTGQPIELARSLTTVASWRLAAPQLASAMVAQHSMLEGRVGRLLNRPLDRGAGRVRIAAMSMITLSAIATAAPALVQTPAPRPEPEAPTEIQLTVQVAPKTRELAQSPTNSAAGLLERVAHVEPDTSNVWTPLLRELDASLDELRHEADLLALQADASGRREEFRVPLEVIHMSLERLQAMREMLDALIETQVTTRNTDARMGADSTTSPESPGTTGGI